MWLSHTLGAVLPRKIARAGGVLKSCRVVGGEVFVTFLKIKYPLFYELTLRVWVGTFLLFFLFSAKKCAARKCCTEKKGGGFVSPTTTTAHPSYYLGRRSFIIQNQMRLVKSYLNCIQRIVNLLAN